MMAKVRLCLLYSFIRYQNGKFLEMDFDEFMEEANKW